MTASSRTYAPGSRGLVRFDAVQRAAHWISALLFTVLVVTAIPLYFGSLVGLVLPRFTVEQIHLWAGLGLPVPLALSLPDPWGARMRRDLRRINVWRREEVEWLASRGRAPLSADKFNPAQKLNAIVVGAFSAVMLGTGVVLKCFAYFPVSWRVGSTFVHDLVAWLVTGLVVGHVVMALRHREALASMVRGRVSEQWAATNAPRWWREEIGDSSETVTGE
ncbi:MAG: cytochrome b/b6 domain-containing protein [Acidimicrobiales bacterium]